MNYRIEKDFLGEIRVADDKYWGAQTQRSLENFAIGDEKMPVEIIRALAMVKKAAASANLDFNGLSDSKAEAIIAVCDEILSGKLDDQFPLTVWQTGSGTQTNMNVNEVIANRATEIMGEDFRRQKIVSANDDVNQSQSSNDAFPTAMHVATYLAAAEHLVPSVGRLRDTFTSKANEFMPIVKTGRTHLMDATPLTLGQEFSGYAMQLSRSMETIDDGMKHILELALGGTAVGTGLNAPPGYAQRAVKEIAELTGYPFVSAENKFEAQSTHDAMVEFSGCLKRLAVSLMHIANNIRILASGPRTGIGELVLPANEPGSSIMPGKLNPTQCEALTMVSAQVIGNDVAVTVSGTHGHLQLNAFKPVIAYKVINSINLLADACRSFNDRCVRGIEPDAARIGELVEKSLMLVTALNARLGYQQAAEIAHTAYLERTTLKQAASKLGYLSAGEFDNIVSPEKMVGIDLKK